MTDEVPPLDRFYLCNLPRHQRFITEHVRIEPSDGSGKLARVHLLDRKELEDNLREKDSVDEPPASSTVT